MHQQHSIVRSTLALLPRWHVVHWGGPETSTLLCLWVGGRETIVPVDGELATYRRMQHPITDGGLVDLLRSIQDEQDRAALNARESVATQTELLEAWSVDGLSAGQWEFPRGGFVRWLNNGVLHIEAGDGGTSERPLSPELVKVLVDLGWNAPTELHRNCWMKPEREQVRAASQVVVLTPLAAFGCETPPPLS